MDNPEFTKTLVGMPCFRDEDDHAPFPLNRLSSTGIRPRSEMPRDMRGMHGSVPVYIPPARRSTPPHLVPPASDMMAHLKDGAIAASVVFMLGAAIVWWLL